MLSRAANPHATNTLEAKNIETSDAPAQAETRVSPPAERSADIVIPSSPLSAETLTLPFSLLSAKRLISWVYRRRTLAYAMKSFEAAIDNLSNKVDNLAVGFAKLRGEFRVIKWLVLANTAAILAAAVKIILFG